jgi:hypothetical protein
MVSKTVLFVENGRRPAASWSSSKRCRSGEVRLIWRITRLGT